MNELGEKVAFLNIEFKPESIARKYPVLLISSGGLFGLDGSGFFRERLKRYTEAGGTIICFSQQHGYEYRALPSGELCGYGWREDQSCHRYAASLENYLKETKLPLRETLNLSIDGSFTNWLANSKIILRRRMNHLPAMLIYQYGKGFVIASTLYGDWGYNHQQGSSQELAFFSEILKDREKKIVIGGRSKVSFIDTFKVWGRLWVFAELYDEEGRLLARALRNIQGYTPSIDITLSTEKGIYGRGEEVFSAKRSIHLKRGEKGRCELDISLNKIEFGTYIILYSLAYEGEEYTSMIEIPSEILLQCEFDKPSYRTGEAIHLKLRLRNAGRFA